MIADQIGVLRMVDQLSTQSSMFPATSANALLVSVNAQYSERRQLKALLLRSVPFRLRVVFTISGWTNSSRGLPQPEGFELDRHAWRVALEARRLGPIWINVRITAARNLTVEATDNGLLALSWPASRCRPFLARFEAAFTSPIRRYVVLLECLIPSHAHLRHRRT